MSDKLNDGYGGTLARKCQEQMEREGVSELAAPLGSASLCSTVPLPDGIVIGGPWPHTIVSWPGGNSRGATKPEYDLFQALEAAHAEIERLRTQTPNAKLCREPRGWQKGNK